MTITECGKPAQFVVGPLEEADMDNPTESSVCPAHIAEAVRAANLDFGDNGAVAYLASPDRTCGWTDGDFTYEQAVADRVARIGGLPE